MNDALVERWNAVVRPEDHVWHLGDVTMLRDNQGSGLGTLRRLNGHKRLILGNHDHYAMKHYLDHFEKVQALHRHEDLVFSHIPIHPRSLGGRMKANVHGHTHQQPDYPPVPRMDYDAGRQIGWIPYINISVERTEYRPISLEELKARVLAATDRADRLGDRWHPEGAQHGSL